MQAVRLTVALEADTLFFELWAVSSLSVLVKQEGVLAVFSF
jgi:hypothetical protein